jgi:hypothetical protein
MEWDSSLGYPESPGFRCGVCYSFSVFDIIKRKTLALMERPLLLMDVSLKQYLSLSPREAIEKTRTIFEQVDNHQGDFVFLWHNSSFERDWKEYEVVFEHILKL